MKPFQLYRIAKFPDLMTGASVSTKFQMTFSGEGEDVTTRVTMEKPGFEDTLDLLRVQSQVRHRTIGFIKTVIDAKRQKVEFSEYLEPVDFNAYLARREQIVVFQASKKACKGVLSNVKNNDCGIDLVEMSVDFTKVLARVKSYQGAWFRGLSTRITAAGVHGNEIQDDKIFQKLISDGQLSNVTFPWQIDNVEHTVMITSSGAIVLVQDYKNNIGLELRIVMDVYSRLLAHVWDCRKSQQTDDACPGAP